MIANSSYSCLQDAELLPLLFLLDKTFELSTRRGDEGRSIGLNRGPNRGAVLGEKIEGN